MYEVETVLYGIEKVVMFIASYLEHHDYNKEDLLTIIEHIVSTNVGDLSRYFEEMRVSLKEYISNLHNGDIGLPVLPEEKRALSPYNAMIGPL